jgi:hypothetical protein
MANWIAGAIKHPGALRKTAGAKKGEKIPARRLEELARSKDEKTAKRARLAQTLGKLRK